MPADYILFIVMKILKEHGRNTSISKENLEKVINEFFNGPLLPKERSVSLRREYKLENKLGVIFDENADFLSDIDGMITLSPYVSVNQIESLKQKIATKYDKELINLTDEFYYFNFGVLEIIGIKMETELYKKIMELEEKIESGYTALAMAEINKKENNSDMLRKLATRLLLRIGINEHISRGLSKVDYKDFYMYTLYQHSLLNNVNLELKKENEKLNHILEADPYFRALFFSNSNRRLVFANHFYNNGTYDEEERENRKRFFLKVIEVIKEKTNKDEYDKTDKDLIRAKYRLMYALDYLDHKYGVYDDYLCMGKERKLSSFQEDYSFAEELVFFLIDEIFEYTDSEMKSAMGIGFKNNIKVVLIEAYYKLTGDDRVVETIKTHPNYGVNVSVTNLFDGIVNGNNVKKK